jgi:hypothetical protein
MSSSPESRSRLDDVLEEIEEFLEDQQDVRDGADGQQLPNKAMSLLMDLQDARRNTAKRSETTEQDAARYRWLVSRESIGWDGWDAFTSITATKEKVDPLIDAELNRSNRQNSHE